jgi:hypothetical protein
MSTKKVRFSTTRLPALSLERLEERTVPSGDLGFAIGFGSTGEDEGTAVATDSAGNVYVSGTFEGTVDFNPGPRTFNLTSAGMSDVFVAKYTALGALVWARSMGGSDVDNAFGMAVDRAGNVYTTGEFSGTADFDPGTGNFSLTSAGVDDSSYPS